MESKIINKKIKFNWCFFIKVFLKINCIVLFVYFLYEVVYGIYRIFIMYVI